MNNISMLCLKMNEDESPVLDIIAHINKGNILSMVQLAKGN